MRSNRRILATAIMAGAFGALGAMTAGAADFTDWAQVVSTRPVIERISMPRQECRNEVVTRDEVRTEGTSPLGAIVGGIAGGVLGHQIGGGRGRDVATAAGAVAGAAIGNNIDNQNRGTIVTPVSREYQRCRTVESYSEVVRGYDVVYRYAGRDVSVHLPYDPGSRVRVAVGVAQ
jgi:uncharacterized protein YcfJ